MNDSMGWGRQFAVLRAELCWPGPKLGGTYLCGLGDKEQGTILTETHAPGVVSVAGDLGPIRNERLMIPEERLGGQG